MNIAIRSFTGSLADYTTTIDLIHAAMPDFTNSVEEWQFADRNRPAHLKTARWIAERAGRPVGYASYTQFADMYHPQRFVIFLAVPPELRRQGIGSALYTTVLTALAEQQAISVRARYRSDYCASERFLQARGFVEDMRDWESRLELRHFDPAAHADALAHVHAHGIRIVTLRELIASDPDHRERLYNLNMLLEADIPNPEPFTPPSREHFAKWVFENPNLLPDGYLVALHGDDYVGSTSLWTSKAEPGVLHTGMTGVRREYRRKGIALALKLRALAFAQAHGTTMVKTWNESNNRGMLSINEALGFVKQPAWVNTQREL